MKGLLGLSVAALLLLTTSASAQSIFKNSQNFEAALYHSAAAPVSLVGGGVLLNDIVVGSPYEQGLRFFRFHDSLGNPQDSFVDLTEQFFPSGDIGVNAINITGADINGDFFDDLVYRTRLNSIVYEIKFSLYNSLQNAYLQEVTLQNVVAPSAPVLADINGDGLLDIVIVDRYAPGSTAANLVYFPQNSSQVGTFFITPIIIDTFTNIAANTEVLLAAADIDNDLDTDVVVTVQTYVSGINTTEVHVESSNADASFTKIGRASCRERV